MSQFIKESDLHTPQDDVRAENIVQNIPQIENTIAQNTEKKTERGKNLKVIFGISILSLFLLMGTLYLIYTNISHSISEKQELQGDFNGSITTEEMAGLSEKTTNQTQEKSKNDMQDNVENNAAMNTYLMRSRDTNRMASLKNFSLAFNVYAVDNGKIPEELSSGCMPVNELKGQYLRSIPVDPVSGRLNDGCTDVNAESTFGYRVLENTETSQRYMISATLETEGIGNSPYSIDELVKDPELFEEVMSGKHLKKGKYYIMIAN